VCRVRLKRCVRVWQTSGSGAIRVACFGRAGQERGIGLGELRLDGGVSVGRAQLSPGRA
jgi:hypothetical protein